MGMERPGGSLVCTLWLSLWAAHAAAQAPPPETPAPDVPPFVLSDRLASPRLFTFDVGLLSPMVGASSWRVDAHASWVGRFGLGVYGAYGMTHVTDTELVYKDLVPDSLIDAELGARTAASNLELGGLIALERLNGLPLTFHVGVVVPIGASAAEGFNFLANLLTSEMRLADWERFTFDMWWIRAGASARGRFDVLLWQVDVAGSIGIAAEDYMDPSPVAHANLGLGLEVVPHLALFGELASLAVFLDDETPMYHSVGVALRYTFAQTSLHAGWSKLFGEELHGHAFLLGAARTY